MPHRYVLAALASLAACASEAGTAGQAAADSAEYLTVVEAPPYPPIERLGSEPVVRIREERRWLFEDRTEARALPLLRRIKREAIGDFGGVEWRWRDGPGNQGLGDLTGIVYFLREPDKTLARYTRDPLFRAARGDFARSDQDRVARAWAERIGRDVASEGFGNMQAPTLNVALPRAEFAARERQRVAAAGQPQAQARSARGARSSRFVRRHRAADPRLSAAPATGPTRAGHRHVRCGRLAERLLLYRRGGRGRSAGRVPAGHRRVPGRRGPSGVPVALRRGDATPRARRDPASARLSRRAAASPAGGRAGVRGADDRRGHLGGSGRGLWFALV